MKTWKNRKERRENSSFAKRIRQGLLMAAASVIVFGTTYMMIIPALTIEKNVASEMPGMDVEFRDSDELSNDNNQAMDAWFDEEDSLDEQDWSDEDGYAYDADWETADDHSDKWIESAEDWVSEGLFEEGDDQISFEDNFGEEGYESLTESATGFPNEEQDTEQVIFRNETENKLSIGEEITVNVTESETVPAQADRAAVQKETKVQTATEKAAETVIEKATEKAAGKAAQTVIETAAEEMTEDAAETATEAGTEEATESLTEGTTEEATESLTEGMTEGATESLTEGMTEGATESLTEEMTEEANESLTEEMTEEANESLTEEMTEEETESVTEEMTEEDPVVYEDGRLRYRGSDFSVRLNYTAEARIPAGARLEVEEILQSGNETDRPAENENKEVEQETESDPAVQEADTADHEKETEAFESYVEKMEEALGLDAGEMVYVRIFDIRIVDENGEKITIAAPVDVKISLSDMENTDEAEESTHVVHFADGAETGDVIQELVVEGEAVSFEAEGFSAYAIVQGPSPVPLGWMGVSSQEELARVGSEGVFLSYNNYYLTGNVVHRVTSNADRDGIAGTAAYASPHLALEAVRYYFEKASDEEDDLYYIYTMDAGAPRYARMNGVSANIARGGLTLVDDRNDGSVFTVEPVSYEGRTCFIISATADNDETYFWNRNNKNPGSGAFIGYNERKDPNTARFDFWFYEETGSDPYGMDGMTCGLMNWNGGAAGKALMAGSKKSAALEAKSLTVLRTTDGSSHLFAPNDSDITMWTFHWVSADRYHLTAEVNGSTKYLKIDENGLSLVSGEENASPVQVIPGTGIHADEICLKCGENTLTYSGKVEEGFRVGGSAGSEWLNLVDLSELTSDYFLTFSASKVSVSGADVTNGSRVIVYTRSWNENKKKYEFYAIGSDGSLVPVYESGDSIEWVSSRLNTLLWNFTEYYWEGTSDPNGYYELYNQYSEQFITPQVAEGRILSGEPIGINLNGRRDGKYYSTILSWDDDAYAYSGLKVEDGKIVSCPKAEAMDFYFAIMQDLNVDDVLTKVPTIDHTQYGITMKIKDFSSRLEMSNFLGNNAGGMGTTLQQGLLSTDLADGYPTAKGGSLATLFAGGEEVNHLFISSIYNASGYFEFDSAQNFATLQGRTGGDFTVYKELGSYDSGDNKNTLKHGQFFPFNDLVPGVFASVNGKNLYSSMAQLLPDSDPRKREQLYLIEHDGQKVDCYFGLELEASFTQTPSGLDAWGHDIIFEFTGDDDFWLYVDGQLVIDLGGIHSAVPGNVNFRTGEVNVNGTNTTLRDLFYRNYLAQNHTAAQAQAYVDSLFVQNKDGQYVFADYTSHTMRIFYMERGAGASNLHMRFNLVAARQGTVELSKQLAGLDETESVMAQFPYQVWYRTDGEEEYRLTNALPHDPAQNEDYVLYKDTVNPVKYAPSVTIDGIEYEDVFFLKPNETAQVSFPEEMTSYRIIECGVNTEVYSSVSVNGTQIEGTAGEGYAAGREDFGIAYASTQERPKASYVNTVDPEALRTLTITKKLYKEDGTTPITADLDDTTFTFRLSLGIENEDPEAAGMYTYHVKDANGFYCSWDAQQQKFVTIGEGTADYSALTAEQKAMAGFATSIYGTISRIPADHTVEIRQILAGTKYQIQERPAEMPDGYSFQKYVYFQDSTRREQGTEYTNAVAGVTGMIEAGADPHIDVCNLKGWGLRMKKVWTDANYMSDREAAYFAVYTRDSEGTLSIVADSLKELTFGVDTLYWYWLILPVREIEFDDYVVREVKVKSGTPSFDSEGNVTNQNALTIEPIKEGGEQRLTGTQKGENSQAEFTYTVRYEQGSVSASTNVRVDTVTNDRPGIILKKQDWNRKALSGAEFTLTDDLGSEIGTFISDEEGFITTAFLGEGKTYTLTETASPSGYHGLETKVEIRAEGGKVSVSGVEEMYYSLTQAEGTAPATLILRNRPCTFRAVKQDGDTEKLLEGVHFELHKQVTVDGVTGFDLSPMTGYEDLVTGADGVIPGLDSTLPAGTYQLREKKALGGYKELSGHVEFTVRRTGAVSLLSSMADADWALLSRAADDQTGTIAYTLTVLNYIDASVTLRKVNESRRALTGAKFRLCKYNESWEEVSDYGEIDLTAKADTTLRGLSAGRYRLEETQAPEGYVILTKYIYFNIEQDGQAVLTDENGTGKNENENADLQAESNLITVMNVSGYALPSTGGAGTHAFYLLGVVMMALAAAGLAVAGRRTRGAESRS